VRSIFVYLVSVLSLVLIQTPKASGASGSGSTPIGSILQATRATGEIDTKYEGATIFDGETVTTDDVTVLRIQFGGPQMVMRPNSAAEVHRIENGFSAKLIAGSVVISIREGQKFQVFADGTTIQPLGETPTTAHITRVGPAEVTLASEKGSLVVSMSEEMKTVEPGNAYRVEIHSESEPSPGGPQSRPLAPGKSNLAMLPVFAVSIATGVIVWRALVSPHKP
jgi:hypothetical protein